uniref:G domain-containing protein n=1 Tax=Globodera rostochiensis TaxID=31243 RepID=A0A914HSX2_GLORO
MHFHSSNLLRLSTFRLKLLNLTTDFASSAIGAASQNQRNPCGDGTPPMATPRFPDFVSRQRFTLPSTYAKQDWFPKHMGLQMKVMEGKLRTVDLVIEVHDARVALTGRNPTFGARLYSIRPHILVLNKMDLISMKRYKEPIEEYYRRTQNLTNICWTNCKDVRNTAKFSTLVDKMLELLRNEHRFNRTVKTEYQVMVVGIPNTGKSSLINALRNVNLDFGKACQEGARPGVTTRVQNRVRILDRPLTYLLDTPGVLNPW